MNSKTGNFYDAVWLCDSHVELCHVQPPLAISMMDFWHQILVLHGVVHCTEHDNGPYTKMLVTNCCVVSLDIDLGCTAWLNKHYSPAHIVTTLICVFPQLGWCWGCSKYRSTWDLSESICSDQAKLCARSLLPLYESDSWRRWMLHTIQELTSCSVLPSRRNNLFWQEPLGMLLASIALLRHLQHRAIGSGATAAAQAAPLLKAREAWPLILHVPSCRCTRTQNTGMNI